MRLFVLTLICSISLVHASNTYAQNTTITIEGQNRTISEVLSEIERQSEFTFFFNNKHVDQNRKVSVTMNNSDIFKILDEIFKNTQVKYSVLGKKIILSTELQVLQQEHKKQVTGKICDVNGESLIGASIQVKGTTIGSITDIDGNYTLEVSNGAILVISYIGYISQEIPVEGNNVVNVALKEDSEVLDEIVVVGYGVQKKSDVTGAMIRVSADDLTSRPVSNAFEAMQGKAAGVDITSNERPGEIGSINIRGVRSLSASNTPLYVVDGIPLMSNSGIETLNPQDIESIDVLKDASATAIYGSRGANGVVLVTTKQGKEGKMSLNYSGTVTLETLQDYSKMMNSAEYIEWRRWAYYYYDTTTYPRADQPTKENDYNIFMGSTDPYAWTNIEKGWIGDTWDGSKVPTTDWGSMVKQTGITHEHTLSASGGTEKMKGYASFGYLNNEGTIKGESYTRYTAKVSTDMSPVKWFKFGMNVNATFSEQQYGSSAKSVGQLSTNIPKNLYAASTSIFPYAVPYDDNGERIIYPGGDDGVKTVVDDWKYSEYERRMLRVIGSIYTQLDLGEIYQPFKGLRYRLNFGPDFRYWRNGIFEDAQSVSRNGSPNYASLENQHDFSWTLDNLIYYDKTIDKHVLGLTFLQSATRYHYEDASMSAVGIPLSSAKWNALNQQNVSNLDSWSSNLTEKQLLSYMFRLNYDYANKYLLTVSGRWDGASQLADGNKWAFFPSVALGWRLNQEEFLKNVQWINQLKLRVGVGVTGNSAIDPYQTKGGIVSLFYPSGSNLSSGHVPTDMMVEDGDVAMANPSLTWEKTRQWNVGLDYSVLDGCISGVLDFYTSHTSDLLMAMTIPALNGYKNTYSNVGETSNIGVDITLNTVNIKTRDFEWSTTINAAWQKDKIETLANGKEDDINNSWFIGHALGVIYGYQPGGLWKEEDAAEMAKFNANGHKFAAGMVRPVDQNHDYLIDPNDDRVVIDHMRPRWTMGMTNIFSFKNVDLSFMLYGRFGYTVDTGGEYQGGRYTQRKVNYYNENNKNAEYQKPLYSGSAGDPYYNILGYKNGSFLKIRNISLGYTFPQMLVKAWGLSNLRVYVQAKNPGRIFSNIDFLELDAFQAGTTTWNRGYTIGLNIGF